MVAVWKWVMQYFLLDWICFNVCVLLFSVTIVVAYLMKRHGMRLSEALAHVKSKRPQAGPNSGFISQLQDFEKSLQGALSLILLYVLTCKLYLMWLVLVIQKKKKIIIALIEVRCSPLISLIKTFKFKPKFVSGKFFCWTARFNYITICVRII